MLEQRTMRFCVILMSCLLCPCSRAQELPKASEPEAPYIEREEKQISFFPGGKIEITAGVPGNIRIVGWQKASIRIEAEKIVYYHSPEKAKALIGKNPIRVRYNQTSASIRTPVPEQSDATMEFNLAIYVPSEKTDVKVQIGRGDFAIESVNGWIETTAREGSLDARSMSGYFSGSTQRGDIYVEMSGNRWRGLEFAVLTQLGSAELRLPSQYSAALQLETRDGKVVVDYPPQVVDGEPAPPDIIIRKNSQSLKASVGDGGAPIKLVTYSGDVKLLRKD